jgi:hypothetical protein
MFLSRSRAGLTLCGKIWNITRTKQEQNGSTPMLEDIRRIMREDLRTMFGEACGLVGLWVAIVAALYLPVLA